MKLEFYVPSNLTAAERILSLSRHLPKRTGRLVFGFLKAQKLNFSLSKDTVFWILHCFNYVNKFGREVIFNFLNNPAITIIN